MTTRIRQNTVTIIGRAAGPDGEGIEVKLADVASDAPDVAEGIKDGLAQNFRKFFGEEPSEVVVVRLPYLHQKDGNDESLRTVPDDPGRR